MSKETMLNVVNPMEIIDDMIERFGRDYNSGIKDIYYNNPEVFPEGMSEDFLQEFDVLEMSAFVINSISNIFDNGVMTFIELDELTRTINQLRVINKIAEDCDDEDIKAEIGPYMIWAVNSMISEIDKIAEDHGNLKIMLNEAAEENNFNHTCSQIIEFNLEDSDDDDDDCDDDEDENAHISPELAEAIKNAPEVTMEELEKKCSDDSEDKIIAIAKVKREMMKITDKSDIERHPYTYMVLEEVGNESDPDYYTFRGLSETGRLLPSHNLFEIPAVVNGKAILDIDCVIYNSVVLPKSITELKSRAIAIDNYAEANTRVYLPDNIERIDYHAFIGKPCNIIYDDCVYQLNSDNDELVKSEFSLLKEHLESNGCKVNDHAFAWLDD